jgi:hypothetical protein
VRHVTQPRAGPDTMRPSALQWLPARHRMGAAALLCALITLASAEGLSKALEGLRMAPDSGPLDQSMLMRAIADMERISSPQAAIQAIQTIQESQLQAIGSTNPSHWLNWCPSAIGNYPQNLHTHPVCCFHPSTISCGPADPPGPPTHCPSGLPQAHRCYYYWRAYVRTRTRTRTPADGATGLMRHPPCKRSAGDGRRGERSAPSC